MSLTFRSGVSNDLPAVARLAMHSFPAVGYSEAEWETWIRDSPRGSLNDLWVGEEEGSIVAACMLYPFEQWIAGQPIRTMGMAMVAISAGARRQGLAARLIISSFKHAVERGDVATALFPFRTSFYQKLGYGIAGEALQFQFPPSDLPDDPGRLQVSLAENDEDRAVIASIYDRWAPGQTGQLVRKERLWEPIWENGSRYGAIYRSSDGEAEGYAAFRYHAVPGKGGRTLEVEEIAWLTREARLGLYGWLSSLSDQWDYILYRAHPDEGFAEHLRERRYPSEHVPRWHFWFSAASLLQGPMFRLLELPKAWAARSVRPGAPLTLLLDVQDDQVPENSGEWMLRLENGRAELRPGGGGADLRMTIGIEPLSRIYIGSLTPSQAVWSGAATVDREERLEDLDSLLRLKKPWTFDRF